MGKRCLVAICHNLPVVYRKTAQSLMEMGWGDRLARAKTAHGFETVDHAWFFRSPRVDALRDRAAVAAMDGPPGGAPYTHLLFLDADMIWPSNVIELMLAHHDKGIVSGLYFLKYPPYRPIALRDGVETDGVWMYQHDKDYAESGGALRPEQVVGMGCTLIPVSVFAQLGPRPWFTYQNDAEGWPQVSEDVPFCRAAAAAGVDIWLDPTIKCGHIMVDVIDEKHGVRYKASEQASQSAVTISPVAEGSAA